ncbi:cation efflux protein [Melampsora americana]|nr:cation efflux protein [Melampsora americana]
MSRSIRIKTLLFIDLAFFFLELIVGYSVGSLALIADSFHMLNDVCSLLVALYAINLASRSKRSEEYSYGWQRAEILGALVNGVFLVALCFSIFLEAIQRAFNPSEVQNPKLVVIVGGLGLASNIVGLVLFHEHGHGHSHSHHNHLPGLDDEAHHHHSHPHEQTPLLNPSSQSQSSSTSIVSNDDPDSQSLRNEICVHPAQTRNNIVRAAEQRRDELNHHHPHSSAQVNDQKHSHSESHSHSHSHSHMNMHAIFLHALGDALGNVGVIITGILIWVIPVIKSGGQIVGNRWVLYADPVISLVITAIIFSSAIPLVRSASLILLQGTPANVNLGRVRKSLLEVKGVIQVHELHIWSLSESKLVASVHVLIDKQNEFVGVSKEIRKRLHRFGIHSSTIQPEVLQNDQLHLLRATNNGTPQQQQTPVIPPTTPTGLSQKVKSFLLSRQNSSQEIRPETEEEEGCLIQCDEACDQEACCPPGLIIVPPSSQV